MAVDNNKQVNIKLNLDAQHTPVLLVDGYLITSNEHAVTLNFAQATINPTEQQIVSRVALTRLQAKEFLKNLSDHIDKFEV